MNYEKKYKKKRNANKFADRLRIIDEKLGDFEDNAIPKVSIDEYNEDYELDMRCTDYGEAMDFF